MSLNLDTKSKDQSCGVTISEVTSQTTEIIQAEKSSETKLNYADIGLDASDFPFTTTPASSQIPKLEMFSKTTGNEYSDKEVNASLSTESKSTEVKNVEENCSDTTLESIRKMIQQEFFKLQNSVHNVQCSICNTKVIYGVRYKCNICKNYNICESCEEKNFHCHPLLKIKHVIKNSSFPQNLSIEVMPQLSIPSRPSNLM